MILVSTTISTVILIIFSISVLIYALVSQKNKSKALTAALGFSVFALIFYGSLTGWDFRRDAECEPLSNGRLSCDVRKEVIYEEVNLKKLSGTDSGADKEVSEHAEVAEKLAEIERLRAAIQR